MNEQASNPTAENFVIPNLETAPQQVLDLRDIHLPDAISWWPIAPGWWFVLASLILIPIAFFIIKNMYARKQLKRDVRSELDIIKQQFQSMQNKSQLAKSLSILLRRASMSYYPKTNIAGLTGNDWLSYLDDTNNTSSKDKFQSDIGNILISAPYLPDDGEISFDDKALIHLCESWLLAPHRSSYRKTSQAQPS